jgi:hypothetical protein
MSEKRYKALRTFFYTPVGGGEERLAVEGQEVTDASDGKIAALLADGLIEEATASRRKEG